jgi:hypothetical protein
VASLDEALHGSRVDAEDGRCLLGRQQRHGRRLGRRSARGTAASTRAVAAGTSVVRCRFLSCREPAFRRMRLILRSVEERKLIRMERHESE